MSENLFKIELNTFVSCLNNTNLKENFDFYISDYFRKQNLEQYFELLKELHKENIVYDYFTYSYHHIYGTEDNEESYYYNEMILKIKSMFSYKNTHGLDNYYLSITNQQYANILEFDIQDQNIIKKWYEITHSYIKRVSREYLETVLGFLN